MSLDFDFTRMIERLGKEEYDRITDHPTQPNTWHPVTNALIWATLGVGMNRITEDNAEKFASRLAALQAVHGADLKTDTGPIYITSRDVEDHIGLSTNASNMNDAQFARKLTEAAVEAGQLSARLQDKSGFEALAAHHAAHTAKRG